MPAGLLGAIAKVETGRRAPDGSVQPWPWSYNAAGDGRYAASHAEALQEVRAIQARGVRSIDIGCMQINLLHHPNAFPSLEAGFDPVTNIAYGVRFLRELQARTGDWNQAVAMYHSATPERGLVYQQRVMAALSGQGFVPGPAPGVIPLPGPAMAGLCASGRGAVMLIGARERPRPGDAHTHHVPAEGRPCGDRSGGSAARGNGRAALKERLRALSSCRSGEGEEREDVLHGNILCENDVIPRAAVEGIGTPIADDDIRTAATRDGNAGDAIGDHDLFDIVGQGIAD
jgi:hypothetical protein